MSQVERLIREFGENGVETTLEVGGRAYTAFAYPSPGRFGSRVRWNLYLADDGSELRGLTFGFAEDVRRAMEDICLAAERHASGDDAAPAACSPSTFRPSPHE